MMNRSFGHRLPAPLLIAMLAWLVLPEQAQAQSREGSFERTLKVTGPVDVTIRTGSGRIRVQPGPGDAVRISARLRSSNWLFSGGVSERLRQIERNPPIEQTGTTIHVGRFADEGLDRNISISYDVSVPSNATLHLRSGSGAVDVGDFEGAVEASTGSGSMTIGRVRGAVGATTGSGSITVSGAASLRARSGSGSIDARDIAGPASATSGSGSVDVAIVGRGDVHVSSSSGGVVVTGIDGAAEVSASSGRVVAEGRPSGAWRVHSSSGSVTVRLPHDASFDLDARASSGGIESAHPVTMVGTIGRQRLQGKVRGGGPLVEVRASSGRVRIQ